MTGMASFYCRCFDGGEPITVGFRLPGEPYPDPSAMFQHEDHEGYCEAATQHERPLEVSGRIQNAHLGGQMEFKTCTVGDTTLEPGLANSRSCGRGVYNGAHG
jgi:hypothetical protein